MIGLLFIKFLFNSFQAYEWKQVNGSKENIIYLNEVDPETTVVALSAEYIDDDGNTVSSGMNKALNIFYRGNGKSYVHHLYCYKRWFRANVWKKLMLK